jgi:hypothetical protein
MSWNGSEIGAGTAERSWVNSGNLTVKLGDVTYTGKWLYTHGGSYSLLNTYGAHPNMEAAVDMSGRGVGNALLTSTSGKRLRCEFNHREWSIIGIGVCQSDDGKVYDIQIY